MKIKLLIAKIFLLCFFVPYAVTFVTLWSNGHRILAVIWALAAAAVIVAAQEAFKEIKHKITRR